MNAKAQDGFYGTVIDVTGYLKPGENNQLTVMVNHPVPAELYLGGLVDPVCLIEKGKKD